MKSLIREIVIIATCTSAIFYLLAEYIEQKYPAKCEEQFKTRNYRIIDNRLYCEIKPGHWQKATDS